MILASFLTKIALMTNIVRLQDLKYLVIHDIIDNYTDLKLFLMLSNES